MRAQRRDSRSTPATRKKRVGTGGREGFHARSWSNVDYSWPVSSTLTVHGGCFSASYSGPTSSGGQSALGFTHAHACRRPGRGIQAVSPAPLGYPLPRRGARWKRYKKDDRCRGASRKKNQFAETSARFGAARPSAVKAAPPNRIQRLSQPKRFLSWARGRHDTRQR